METFKRGDLVWYYPGPMHVTRVKAEIDSEAIGAEPYHIRLNEPWAHTRRGEIIAASGDKLEARSPDDRW